MSELHRIDTCVSFLKQRISDVPDRAIVLGSGLGGLAEKLTDALAIPYAEIPEFPTPTVIGHSGQMIVGKLNGVPVIVLAGRFHYYEGHSLPTVVFPARVLARMGVKSLMITNAAGGVNITYKPGDLMLIDDHINLTGHNPLAGDNIEELGTRFPDMSRVYSRGLKRLARQAATDLGIDLKEGVYAWMPGPSYETPAEVRMVRVLGADAVGMSTVPEATAAYHAGMRIVGVSLITNMAAGVLDQPLTHEEVTATAVQAAVQFEALATEIIKGM